MVIPEELTPYGIQARRMTSKTKHNLICVGDHYSQTNTNNVNNTWALLQTTGEHHLYVEIVTDITTRYSERKYP